MEHKEDALGVGYTQSLPQEGNGPGAGGMGMAPAAPSPWNKPLSPPPQQLSREAECRSKQQQSKPPPGGSLGMVGGNIPLERGHKEDPST